MPRRYALSPGRSVNGVPGVVPASSHPVSWITNRAPLFTATTALSPSNSLWNPTVSPASILAPSSGYSKPLRSTPSATPETGKTERLSPGLPPTALEPFSTTNISPHPATAVARTPPRSAASSRCGRAKTASGRPPVTQMRSISVAPLSRAARTARCPSILSFLAGWRSRRIPRSSTRRVPPPPSESMSPTTRSGTTPAASACRAPPSAASTRSARPATPRSRPGGSGDPLRKTTARKLVNGGAPVPDLARRRLRPLQRPQQHDHRHDGYGQARDQVRRVVRGRVDVRVPALRRVGGEEDDAGDEVAGEARQDGDRRPDDGPPNGGPEKAGETQGAEGQRVVQEDLDGVKDGGVGDQVEQAGDGAGEDPHPPPLAQGQQDQGHHLQGYRAPVGHLEDLDQAENERERDGERRLGQDPRVPESVQMRTPPSGKRGCADEILLSPCAGITRIRFSGSAPDLSVLLPSQPRGSPVVRPPSLPKPRSLRHAPLPTEARAPSPRP